jgi:hypothetical protein
MAAILAANAMPGLGSAQPVDQSVDALAQLMEARLGGMMLVRIGLAELIERFKQEEHALAMSLKAILTLRDEERNVFRAQLDSAHAYAHQLEAQLVEAQRLRGEAFAAAAAAPPLGGAAPAQEAVAPAGTTSEEPAHEVPAALPSVEDVAARLNSQAGTSDFTRPTEASSGAPAALPVSAAGGRGSSASGALPPAAADAERASEAPSADAVSYLARVEQLQQRLARERSSLPVASPSACAGGAGGGGGGGGVAGLPSARLLSGGPPAARRQSSEARASDASADPFDVYERGELLARERPPPRPPPAVPVLTGSGEPFVFRHLSREEGGV